MDIIEILKTRRSIRKFRSDPLSEEQILELLEVANLAPTGGNLQPCYFLVISRSYLDEMMSILENSYDKRVQLLGEEKMEKRLEGLPIEYIEGSKSKGLRKFYKSFGGAPVTIVAYIKRDYIDEWQWSCKIQDVAASIQNLIIAAWGKGIGTCWLTGPLHRGAQEIHSFLKMPEDTEIVALVALGYPAEQPLMPPKRNIAEKVQWLGF